MTLSDAQIDRYSRQIILPQIGAQGQQRLLQSAVAVVGDGALAEVVALYLAGAGVGRIALQGIDREALHAAIMDLNPDVAASLSAGAFGEADLLMVCNATLAQLDHSAAARRPVIAGGDRWLVVASNASVCAGCAARAVSAVDAPPSELDSPVYGVIGSLMALAALKFLVGIAEPPRRAWQEFDPLRSALTEHRFERAADCPSCPA
jgi:adenylyltransferase/sulfurtransferase